MSYRGKNSEILSKWLSVYESHFTHQGRPEERSEILRALEDIHPSDLDAACLRALQECQWYPKIADIRARVERRHEEQDQEIETLWLRNPRGECYAGTPVDGKYATKQDKIDGRYTGKTIRFLMRCGCAKCDPAGWEDWERKNAVKKSSPLQPKQKAPVAVMTPISEIKAPVAEASAAPFWWDEESEPQDAVDE